MDEYAVLGIPRYATVEEIKSAYRERARFVHPDRHVRADGTVPVAVQEAFVRLHTAFRTAMARATAEPPRATVPQQRRAPAPQLHHTQPPSVRSDRAVVPPRHPRAEPALEDPLLMLLTVPQRCRTAWPDEALEAWALTLVPRARTYLAEARRTAEQAGATGTRRHPAATAHVLLTLTLSGLKPGRWTKALCDHVDGAYDALELSVPTSVLDRLPARAVVRRRGLHLLR